MPDFQNSDKFIHLICFTALACCWCLWFNLENWKLHPFRCVLFVVTIVSVYGIIDEIHQYFVPGRHASVLDWLADTLGGICGGIIGLVLTKFLQRNHKYLRHGDNSNLS